MKTYSTRPQKQNHNKVKATNSARFMIFPLFTDILFCFSSQVPSQGTTMTPHRCQTAWLASINMRTFSCLPQPIRHSPLPFASFSSLLLLSTCWWAHHNQPREKEYN